MATLYGTVLNDTIEGTVGDDVLHGGAEANPAGDVGNDLLLGLGGNDLLLGYSGNDNLYGGAGGDTVLGSFGTDQLFDGDGIAGAAPDNDSLSGGGDNDTLYSYGGADTLDGGLGSGDLAWIDRSLATASLSLVAGPGATTIIGDGTIITAVERFTILFGFGNDVISAVGSLSGNGGNDTITGTAAAETTVLSGGDGDDLLLAVGTGRLYAFGDAGNDRIDATGMPAGSGYRLVATGGAGDDTVTGGAGNDEISDDGGRDSLDGGAGNDTITYGFSAIPLDATLAGGTEGDLIVITGSVADVSAARFDGGAGNDVLRFVGTVLIAAGTAQFVDFLRLDLRNPEAVLLGTAGANLFDFAALPVTRDTVPAGLTLFAGAGNDSVTGTAFGNVLLGEEGNDSLLGGAGFDALSGGAGRDVLDGGSGPDSMAGGPGNDTYRVDTSGETLAEAPDAGIDTVIALADWSLGENFENLTLIGADNYAGTGNGLKNRLIGNDGANTLSGLGGDDQIRGGRGDDALLGGDGRDRLQGGRGADTLTGGAGRDFFQFAAPTEGIDSITDFTRGEDRIEVAATGFGGELTAGLALGPAGRFVAGTAATQAFGQFLFDASTGLLSWDADGTGAGAAIGVARVTGALFAVDIVVVA